MSGSNKPSASKTSVGAPSKRHPSSGTNRTSTLNEPKHEERIEAQRHRLDKMTQKTKDFSSILAAHQQVIQPVGSIEKMAKQYHYRVEPSDDGYYLCSNVSQANLASIGHLHRATFFSSGDKRERLMCREINLNNLSGSAAFRLNTNLAMFKYFGALRQSSRASSASSYFLKVRDIFLVRNSDKVFVFHERFTLEQSLDHHQFNGMVTVPLVKQWVIQLAEAVEQLNLHGVAHRFIRSENVLASLDGLPTLKLTSFDMAWRFWDSVEGCSIASPKKGLPLAVHTNLLDHLPPEAFEDNYDCSMVDVWSVGVLACKLLALENPFEAHGTKLTQWRNFALRPSIGDELRSLLDDIFVGTDDRMTAFDLVKDKRLQVSTGAHHKTKPAPYYRIDLTKNINLTQPAKKSVATVAAVSSHESFSSNYLNVSEIVPYKKQNNEQDIGDFQVLRSESFYEDDYSPFKMFNYYYLKAMKKGATTSDCLVKIVQQTCVPTRHFAQTSDESCKIMHFMSTVEPHKRHIHRVLDIYLVGCDHLYIFYEHLQGHRSIDQVVRTEHPDGTLPVSHVTGTADRWLSLANVHKWTQQLIELVQYMASQGLTHRYIRSEFVFIQPANGDIKLTHFDLACSGWIVKTRQVVRRHRGLQDELEGQWDHLPPECFEQQYVCLSVDVWSVAVLLVYCLAGQTPFSVPLSMDSAIKQWQEFKDSQKAKDTLMKLSQVVAILDTIFVSPDRRPSAKLLVSKFSATELQMAIEPTEEGANQNEMAKQGEENANTPAIPESAPLQPEAEGKEKSESAKDENGNNQSLSSLITKFQPKRSIKEKLAKCAKENDAEASKK